MGLSGDRRGRGLSTHQIGALVFAGSAVSGTLAGLSAAAGGLAVNGRPLFEWQPGDVQLFLVVGPLLGLWPVAVLALLAARLREVRRWTPAGLGLWLGVAVVTTLWFGLVPLLR